ncbi:MAG: glycosyltransferase [Anaerovoracaceae bacterium]
MKVLILTGKFGMGHCSAANSIKEMLKKANHEVEIVDIVESLAPVMNKVIYGSFNKIVKSSPELYNWFIKATDKNESAIPFKKIMGRKTGRIIDKSEADIVISTLHLSSQYVGIYKELSGNKVPLFTVITDISSKDEWIAPNTDRYFVATEKVKNGLVKKGIPSHIIQVSGIPVRSVFSPKRRDVNSIKDKKEILIMGGGLGLMPIPESQLKALNCNGNFKTTIITGSNAELHNKLKNRYHNINVVGFVKNVDEYMKNADLLVTKAGGICMFEAIRSELPMFVVEPFLAQEMANANFIKEKNIGDVCSANDMEYANKISKLLDDDSKIISMRRNMRELKKKVSQERIINEVSNFSNYNYNYNHGHSDNLVQAW